MRRRVLLLTLLVVTLVAGWSQRSVIGQDSTDGTPAASPEAATPLAATPEAGTPVAASPVAATPIAGTPQAEPTPVDIQREGAEQVVQPTTGAFPGPNSIQLLKVADGLESPRVIVSAHDGTGRLFIGEQAGLIKILTPEGELLPEPFLDMRYLVASNHQEQGILGMAFHPEYETNGLFYVSYTDIFVNGTVVVAQFQVSPDDPNRASTEGIRDILKTPHPTPDLNGGTIHFGPDGFLYVSIGNAGFYGIHDVFSAQTFDSHLGKMLRLQVGFEDGPTYEIPHGNPFLATYEYWHAQHIWSIGLRNAWQWAFDPDTGDMYIPDVGESGWEEINYVPASSTGGQNFGWPLWEGTHCVNATSTGACPALGTLPVAQYPHGDQGCAVVGLAVYRGAISPLDGSFLVGDYCSGKIWSLHFTPDQGWVFQELLDTSLMLAGGGNDDDGEVYVISCECGGGAWSTDPEPGAIWKVILPGEEPEGAEVAPLG
jgi:glucose/arabinose dehydrogenase